MGACHCLASWRSSLIFRYLTRWQPHCYLVCCSRSYLDWYSTLLLYICLFLIEDMLANSCLSLQPRHRFCYKLSVSNNLLCCLDSVGKSTLLTMLTGTQSEAAAYEFTTLTCIPGIINYNDAKIQLLDLPGIIEGASEGKGRGRQVCNSLSSSLLYDTCLIQKLAILWLKLPLIFRNSTQT